MLDPKKKRGVIILRTTQFESAYQNTFILGPFLRLLIEGI
jgi:hypothetical protein